MVNNIQNSDYVEYTLKKPIRLYQDIDGDRVEKHKQITKIYIDTEIKVKHLKRIPKDFFDRMNSEEKNFHASEMLSFMGAMCNLAEEEFDEITDIDLKEIGEIVQKISDKKKL